MPTVPSLFDIFSANLELYRMEGSRLFICPLCLRTFTRNQIRELSKAHIIPKFLGGKQWTLTCKACNNKVGTEIEACEAERANCGWALSGDGKETTRAEIWYHGKNHEVVGPVQADMRKRIIQGKAHVELFAKPQGSNPVAWELHNDVQSGRFTDKWEAEVRYTITKSSKRANLTYVHAAYLTMFHQFGYEWALDPCSEPIRKQIMSPDEPIILPKAPRLYGLQIPDDHMGVWLVRQPAKWRHFLVVLPLLPHFPERQAVWMPLFGRPYKQPPPCKKTLEIAPVPDHHQFLHSPNSRMQGFRFVLNHFAYDPVLYAGDSWF